MISVLSWQTLLAFALLHSVRQGQICLDDITNLMVMSLSKLQELVMAPHSSTLAWKIPWMEEPRRLQPWVWEESDMTE